MKEEQFDVLVKLMRGNPNSPTCIGARLVLVESRTQGEAHRVSGATRQTISDAVKKYTKAFELVTEAWAPKKRTTKTAAAPTE